MGTAKIVGSYEITGVKEVSVDYNGFNYLVVYGKHINGGFFAILNWNVCGELGDPCDTFWNSESITRGLKDSKAGLAIAEAIAIHSTGNVVEK